MWTVHVPASLSNLGPGYDVLGLAVSRGNTFRFEHAGGWVADGQPLAADDHLALRTARDAVHAFGGSLSGLAVEQDERVPRARGLGSSATARVAGLMAGLAAAGLEVPLDAQVAFLARAEGHPDNVVPARVGGLVVCGTDGDAVRFRRLDPPPLRVALAIPDVLVETAAARRILPAEVPHGDAVFNTSRIAWLLLGLLKGDAEAIRLGLDDRLHQAWRARLIGPVDDAFGAARDAGALGAFVSGSGSTLAAFVPDGVDASAVADAMAAPFHRDGVVCAVDVVIPASGGASLTPG